VAATEAAAHVAATTHVPTTTAAVAATTAARESVGGRKRERCCENCYDGEFLAHEFILSIEKVALHLI
jgi:hypothetical protein